jgi:hypothetical protein
MAERAAAGDFGALFQTVFHPLYPALVAVLLRIAPALDPVVAGQVVACGLAALAVLPLWAVARALFGDRAAFWCGFVYATGAWFARTPAECMSEGPFYLGVAVWAHALLGGRPLLAGAASAFAWLARPEGMALAAIGSAWLFARRERRGAVLALAVALLLGALLPLGYAVFGGGWTLTPKAAFNYEVGVGGSDAPALRYLKEAAGLPPAALEDLGWLWFPLMVAGAVRFRPRHWRDPAVPLLLPFLAQCAVVPLLRSHHRFLSGFGALLCAFGGAAVPLLLDAVRRRHRAGPLLVVTVLVASEARIVGARNQDRTIERELGRALRAQLRPGEVVVSDNMPRLDYFAGQKPPPPRPILPADLLARAADPACRYVVLVERQPESGDAPARRRTDLDLARLRELGLEPLSPGSLPSAPSPTSDVLIFERPRTR